MFYTTLKFGQFRREHGLCLGIHICEMKRVTEPGQQGIKT